MTDSQSGFKVLILSILFSLFQPALAATAALPAPTQKPLPQKLPPKPLSTPTALPHAPSSSQPAPAVTSLPSQPPSMSEGGLTPQNSYPKSVSIVPSSPVLDRQETEQNKYVAAINELQMLKIQKEIAETSQAIVAAKLATATAEKSISDLLTEAAAAVKMPQEQKPAEGPTNVPPPSPSFIGPTSQSGEGYSVQSVSFEQDSWHAAIKFKDKLYDVGVGDLMPPDRSLVKQIDQNGVTLENAGMEQRVPLSMTDNDAPASHSTGNPGASFMSPGQLSSPSPSP